MTWYPLSYESSEGPEVDGKSVSLVLTGKAEHLV